MTMTREEFINRDLNVYLICEEIISEFPPRYWNKDKDGTVFKIQVVSKYSPEYDEILNEVKDAEHKYSLAFGLSHPVWFMTRIENKFTYARFILRAKHLEVFYSIKLIQKRMFKIMHVSEVYQTFKYSNGHGILSYNYNINLMNADQGTTIFFSYIPYMPPDYSVIAVQVLMAESNSHCDVIYGSNTTDFYVEYIINYKP